jgi:hypothetical protein
MCRWSTTGPAFATDARVVGPECGGLSSPGYRWRQMDARITAIAPIRADAMAFPGRVVSEAHIRRQMRGAARRGRRHALLIARRSGDPDVARRSGEHRLRAPVMRS